MELIRLLLRNTLRHKLRSLLTIVGIAVAVMAFVLLRTVVTAWHAGVEASTANRLVTRHAVSFVFPLPLSYRDRIAQVRGVDKVTYATWFSGIYIDKKQFFARLAVDSESFFDVYPEFVIEREQFEGFKRERNSAIIGIDIANRYNLKLGDVMSIDGDVYPGRWEFVVRGIYQPRDQTTNPASMMFHHKYIDERVRQEAPHRAADIGWYIVRIANPDDSASWPKPSTIYLQTPGPRPKPRRKESFNRVSIGCQRNHHSDEYHVVCNHLDNSPGTVQHHDHVCARKNPRVRGTQRSWLYRP